MKYKSVLQNSEEDCRAAAIIKVAKHYERTFAIDSLIRYSMACPAMPLCDLAIKESERAMPPGILARIRIW